MVHLRMLHAALLAIRTGKAKKGQELYERAIAMAVSGFKAQLRKKLHWELAIDCRKNGDLRGSRRHLVKVLKTRSGSIWKLQHLDAEAQRLLDQTQS